MSDAEDRAQELLSYYDSCRGRGTTIALTADTTDTIRDLIADLTKARNVIEQVREVVAEMLEQLVSGPERRDVERIASILADAEGSGQ
ncbi:hypothetical protein EF294_03290 [Gordonia oryzae]|uniref:Uncharacterized protein n=1 Tax=Gordonia oryzae TaxID=2487349 RepID=A0A3N4HFW7_9ACTN|nr:hypothetical protein [Gordonia oryzae]RPA65774.1 hypothetical protein EF294_03290 [Gordonia oryzae]